MITDGEHWYLLSGGEGMMKIATALYLFYGHWTPAHVRRFGKAWCWVFGDNEMRKGKGGQAVVRDMPGAIGIRTKRAPHKGDDAYWSDDDYESNTAMIEEDIEAIFKAYQSGRLIVLSAGGYGTGLSRLMDKAPLTYLYLSQRLGAFINYCKSQ